MRTRMVRVRRRMPKTRRMAFFFVLALALYFILNIRRGDPVRAVLEARDAERIQADITLDALELHAVRTAVCDSEETARIEAARYANRGAAGYIFCSEVRHVLCAGYETEEDARAVSMRLNEEEGMNSDVLSLLASAVTIRASASQAQIDALLLLEKRLRETESLLCALSSAVDGGTTVPQAVSALDSQRKTLDEAASALRRAAGGDGDSVVCAPLLDLAGKLSESLYSLNGITAESAVASGLFRRAFLEARINHILYLAGLGG